MTTDGRERIVAFERATLEGQPVAVHPVVGIHPRDQPAAARFEPDRLVQVRPRELGPIEQRAVEVGPAKNRRVQACIAQIRPTQIRAAQVRPAQVGLAEVHLVQVSPTQLAAVQGQ